MRDVRGNAISMIFQEPMTSLNPVFTCGDQIAEAIIAPRGDPAARGARTGRSRCSARSASPTPKRRAGEYPHQLSGGMRQRVMIAMALASNPELLIADEPTTALDVTIQAQILELMKDLRERNRMAIMLITHDLGVIAEMADDVVVMYAGQGRRGRPTSTTVFEQPAPPVHAGASSPRSRGWASGATRLEVIQGVVPNPLNLPTGCLFKRRCPYAMPVCDTPPPLQEIEPRSPVALLADARGRAAGHRRRCRPARPPRTRPPP